MLRRGELVSFNVIHKGGRGGLDAVAGEVGVTLVVIVIFIIENEKGRHYIISSFIE